MNMAETFINYLTVLVIAFSSCLILGVGACCLGAINKVKENQRITERYMVHNQVVPTGNVSQQEEQPQPIYIARGTAIN